MKSKFLLLIALVPLFLSSCVKSLEEEGVSIDNVTHFSYGGYTYQVHHDLGQMTWSSAQSACNNLVAYGHDDWFMPSMGEMQAARDAGLTWVVGWTSTFDEYYYDTYYYYCYDDSDGYRDFIGTATWAQAPICPMRKE